MVWRGEEPSLGNEKRDVLEGELMDKYAEEKIYT